MKKILISTLMIVLATGSLSAQTIIDSVLYIDEGTTEIAYKAYYGNKEIKKVEIPSTVTKIGGLAFHNCTNLEEIDIPASVTTIGDAAFQNDSSLTKVTLHEGLTNLSYRLFKSCVSLTEITIPSTITEFGDYSLAECDNLTTIKVDRYTEAHTYFCKDSRLAFTDNPPKQSREQWLATATRDIIEDSVLYIKPGTTVIKGDAYIYAKAFTKVVIPNTVTEIGKQAFFGTNVREVTIPGSVKIIKNSAFYCSHLEKAILEEGVKEIDSYAFNTYRKLYIYVPNSVDTLAANNGITNGEAVWTVVQGSYAEEYVKSRCSYNIDYTQPYSAYSGETALKVSINGNVSTDYFKNCPNLQSVDIGPGVTEIVSGTFADNLTLRAKRNTYADTWAKQNGYYLCGVLADLNVYIKDASKQIEEDFTRILCDDDSYANWTSYKYVIQQPLKLEEVDNKLVLTSFMLYPCENVTVTDKNGKTLISNKTIQPLTRTVLCDFDFLTDSVENFTLTTDDAFYKELTSIITKWTISYNGTAIRLTKTEMPTNPLLAMYPVYCREWIATIYDHAYVIGSDEYEALLNKCVEEKLLFTDKEMTQNLTKEQMDKLLNRSRNYSLVLGHCDGGGLGGGNLIYLVGGWLYEFGVMYPHGFYHEFSHCMDWGHTDGNMCDDDMPNGYVRIGATIYKQLFEAGDLPYTDKYLLNSKFFSYNELRTPDPAEDEVIDSVLYIGEGIPCVQAHKEQTDFTTVEIPSSVSVLGNSAFYGTKIENVEIPSSVTIIKKLAFHSCEELKTITIPSSVKEIGDAAFQNCTSLTSVEIPNSLRELNTKLFKSSGLTEITIPANIKLIGKEAFADCQNLKTVVIENGVRKIDNNAFYNTGIDTIEIPESVTEIGKNITPKGVVWKVKYGSTAYYAAMENNYLIALEPEFNEENAAQIIADSENAEAASTEGWKKNDFTSSYERRTWDFSSKLEGAGTYTITFKYTGGECMLSLADALFTADGKAIAFIPERRTAGSNPSKIVYEISVPAGTESLMFYALARTGGGTDSKGKITVSYQPSNNGNGDDNGNGNGDDNGNTETSVNELNTGINIYAIDHTIIVENATDEIRVYDIMGQLICRDATPCVRAELRMYGVGVYIVKIGNLAKKVFVD